MQRFEPPSSHLKDIQAAGALGHGALLERSGEDPDAGEPGLAAGGE